MLATSYYSQNYSRIIIASLMALRVTYVLRPRGLFLATRPKAKSNVTRRAIHFYPVRLSAGEG